MDIYIQIYTGCNEAYRLNENGNLNVPRDATDIFCTGPCLAETQLVLKCVDNILSDFTFYNKATVRDIRDVLHAGCSYTSRRGMGIFFFIFLHLSKLFWSLIIFQPQVS